MSVKVKAVASKYKVQLVTVPVENTGEISKIQAKINTWITTGILIKYEVHATATHILFNILKIK